MRSRLYWHSPTIKVNGGEPSMLDREGGATGEGGVSNDES